MYRSLRFTLMLSVLLFASAIPPRPQQGELWAVVGVQEPLVSFDPEHLLGISFGLVNDGQQTVSTDSRNWKILINGQEVADSGFIFGNGPAPVGGWENLGAGGSFMFGKSLKMGRYFSKPGIYEVSWKSSRFSAKPVVVRVLPLFHAD